MRLFLTLIPDPTPDSATPADPPSRVVLALPAAAAAAPATIHDLATLIAGRFSLTLHPAHKVPRLYLSNDFVLPAADPVADLLQPGDQVTVRYVPRPPGRRLPSPSAEGTSSAAAADAGRKRKRSSYSVSSSASESDSISAVPSRPRGPSLKRRRNAADPLPSLTPALGRAVAPEADPLLVHQIAETVTRRIAGLIESVLPMQEPMRRAQRDGEQMEAQATRRKRRSAARAASKLQEDESDDESASSMDSDYEAISVDEDEDESASSEEEHAEEDEAERVDPFEDEADADPFEGNDMDPFDDDEVDQSEDGDGDGDVTPTGHGLVGTFVDSDSHSDHSDDDDDSDESGDDDLELQAYLESHARAKPKRPVSSPSTMMGLFGPMGQGPAGMANQEDSSDDGVSQAFDNLLARINVSVTSRGNSGSDTTSDSDSSSDSDDSSSSPDEASDKESESSNDASSSSSDAQSDSSSSSDSDSDSGPESAPISTATKLNTPKPSTAAAASTRTPSPVKPAPASPPKRPASPAAEPTAAAGATRPGRIWATAVDLAQFPAKRIAPSKERVQLAKAHNAAVANGSATGSVDFDSALVTANGKGSGDSEQQHKKKTRRSKRGGAGRTKPAARDMDSDGDSNATSDKADSVPALVDYATCAKLTPSKSIGMPAGSRVAFKRMQLSAQCTPEVTEYAEYEVVRTGLGEPLVVVPVEVADTQAKHPAAGAFGNGAAAAKPSVVAGGWGPEVVLDDDDDEMDVDQWEEDEEEEGSVWPASKKRKRPTGLAKFMMGEDAEEAVGQEQAGAEPFAVDWEEMVEPVIVKWGSGS